MNPPTNMPVNNATARDPKWTGKEGETAVLVSRGEPSRTDVQMQQVAYSQIERYLAQYTEVENQSPLLTSLTSQLIAQDHIKPGVRTLHLNREHLLAYVGLAQQKIEQLGGAR